VTLNPALVLASFGIGIVVGLTGMGALAFVLLASALKLLHVPTRETAVVLVLALLFAPVLYMLVRRHHGLPALARVSGHQPVLPPTAKPLVPRWAATSSAGMSQVTAGAVVA